MLTVTITQVPGKAFEHSLTARHHTVTSDVGAALGGQDTGPTPHELMLLALGACTAMTLEMKAAKSKWALSKVTVTVTEQAIDDPDSPNGSGKKIPQITENIQLEGQLSTQQIASLKRTAEHCPVYQLLTGKKQVVTNLALKP